MNQRTAIVAAVLLLTPGLASAQDETFEWVPYAGAFVPTGELARTTVTPDAGIPITLDIEQETAFMFGSRIVAWWSPTWGWEGNFGYALSNASVTADGGVDACAEVEELNCSSSVWMASSKILARWAPSDTGNWYLFGGLGLAVVGHVGEIWTNGDATTDLGGVVGAGAVFDLSRRFAIRLDVEDYIYSFKPKLEDDPGLGTADLQSRTQNDLAFSLGLVIRIHGS